MCSLAIIQERSDNLFRCEPANENISEWGDFYRLMRETDQFIKQYESHREQDHIIQALIERRRP